MKYKTDEFYPVRGAWIIILARLRERLIAISGEQVTPGLEVELREWGNWIQYLLNRTIPKEIKRSRT